MRHAMVVLGVAAMATLAGPMEGQGFDTVRQLKLEADTMIDGYHCGPTGRASAEFHESGALASCPLFTPTIVAGHSLPAGTWIQLTDTGQLWSVWLPADTKLAGRLCHGTGYKGWSVRFHETGALAMCYLGTETQIDGVWCQRGTFWNELRGGFESSVGFHPSGRLRRCQASRSFEKDGVRVQKWQVVEMDEAGAIRVRM